MARLPCVIHPSHRPATAVEGHAPDVDPGVRLQAISLSERRALRQLARALIAAAIDTHRAKRSLGRRDGPNPRRE